ncbi:MAG: murein biosynthesis integral membrane protein MurJ, partial [Aggregatilineales bacterium]
MTDSPDLAPAESQPASRALSSRQIARAAGLVMIGFALSRLLGLLRASILAGVFGADRAYEAFVVALQVPDTIFFVIAGGAIGSAFIPTFTDYLAEGRVKEGWRMASSVINLLILGLVVVAGLTALFAGPIVRYVIAPGFDAEATALTVRLMRIMLISPIVFGISGLQMGVLNAHQRFLLPALAPSMYSIGIIIGAVVIAPLFDIGIFGAAWGVVLGAVLHLGVQVPGLLKLRAPYHLLIDVTDPGVREVARLMGPRVLGQAIVQVNFWVNKALASGMVEGSLAALDRAWYVMMLPQGLIAQSVATVVFPTFAAQVAAEDTAALRRTLGQVLRSVLFLAIPATVGLIVLRLPIVRLIYEHGDFSAADSEAVSWALLFFGLGLIAHSLVEIVTRAFYAMHDTRTPVLIGGAAMLLNVVLSFTLIRFIGDSGSLVRGPFAGLALANTIATTLEAALLLALVGPRVGGLE